MGRAQLTDGAYRLRIFGDEGDRCYWLARGVNRIGTAEDNDVVLGERGISRHHAQLEIDSDGCTLEDLGSRNGTFVDGESIRREPVRADQKIRLARSRAELEIVDVGDAELALTLDPAYARAVPAPSLPFAGSTEAVPGTASTALDFSADLMTGLLESLADRDVRLTETDLLALLERLSNASRAAAAWLIEWHPVRGAVVRQAYGSEDPPAVDAVAAEAFQRLEPTPGGPSTTLVEKPPFHLYCGARQGGASPLGLLLHRAAAPPPAVAVDLLLQVADGTLARQKPAAVADRSRLRFPEGWVVATSTAMRQLYRELESLVDTDLPVLVEGETGAGKEHVVDTLHASSRRATGPLVTVNCAAIPADLLEAELFGIGEQVATGVRGRTGLFRQADGGTLFLDEIGDMPAALQAKLLRVLQEKQVRPVGEAPVGIDVRVVAATNIDLQARAEEGRFRRDLYYRIAGAVCRLPPLRERRADIPALVQHFLRRETGPDGSVRGKSIRGVTVKALAVLVDYAWPGNVRELENEVCRLAALCRDDDAIDSSLLPNRLLLDKHLPLEPSGRSLRLRDHVAETEKRVITAALVRADGSQRQAAKILAISRNALARKIQRLGIEI